MLDSLSPIATAGPATTSQPYSASPVWPDATTQGVRWVEEARKSAPRPDSLLTWAFRQGASRVSFQTGHSPWVSIHGRNNRVAETPIDEIELVT